MSASQKDPGPIFSQPVRAFTAMVLVCLFAGAVLWLIQRQIEDILFSNLVLNGVIAFVFLVGVVICFWQVWRLAKSVGWIEAFVASPDDGAGVPPALLAPLATLLRSRRHKSAISASSGRTILDSVAQRMDESRDVSRYLVNLLVFLGLLGTFWGLATTVPAVVDTIRNLSPGQDDSGIEVFARLMQGLEAQLGGMGTAFSSSLFGLGGSLVLGLLDLFAGHGQNRFYRELEEWLSSISRIGLWDGEGGDQSALVQVLDHMAGQMEIMQDLSSRSEQTQIALERRIGALTKAIDTLAVRLPEPGEQAAQLSRLADGQEQVVALLSGSGGDGPGQLHSIDAHLAQILAEATAGRQESVADLRADLSVLTAALRQLSRRFPPVQE